MIKTIADVAETYKNVHSTKAGAHICYAALSLSCHVAEGIFGGTESDTQEIQLLLFSQAVLLYSITG
ncbi:hypothetical protein X975_13725, partial [Stegodyphus mimosarum]